MCHSTETEIFWADVICVSGLMVAYVARIFSLSLYMVDVGQLALCISSSDGLF